MKKWFEVFFEEKNVDMEEEFVIETTNNTHFIPAGAVVEHIMVAPRHEQEKIKNILVQIDFKNGDVSHFLKHLAGALAANY